MQTISTPSNHVSSAKVYVCSFCSACFPSLTQECSHSDEPGIEIGSGSLFWPPNKHYNFASFRKYQRETRTRKQTYRLVYITWNFKQKHTHTHILLDRQFLEFSCPFSSMSFTSVARSPRGLRGLPGGSGPRGKSWRGGPTPRTVGRSRRGRAMTG